MRNRSARPGQPTRIGATRTVRLAASACLALGLVIVGCGGDEDAGDSTVTSTTAGSTGTDSPATTDDDGGGFPAPTDPGTEACIDTADVAEVVGGDVDLTSSFGAHGGMDLTYTYQGCSYADRDHDGTSYDIVTVTVTTDHSSTDFDALDEVAQADLEEDGFTPIDELGDEAYLDGVEVAVRRGATMFTVEVEDAEGDGDAAQAQQLAAGLVDADLSGDDAACAALTDAFETVVGPVDDERRGGGASSVGDVEISTRNCTVLSADGTSARLGVTDSAPWDAWVAQKRDSSFTSWYSAGTIGEYASFDDGESLFVDTPDQPLKVTITNWDGDASEGDALRVALAELALSS